MRRMQALACSAVLAYGAIASAVGESIGKQTCELTIRSALQTKVAGQPKAQSVAATTNLVYAWDGAAEKTLSVQSLAVKVTQDGKNWVDSLMSRDAAVFQQANEPSTRLTYDKAPAPLQATLRQFDTPIATVEFDPIGSESGRKILVAADSPLVQNGIVDDARFFHAPFPSDKDRWEAPVKLSMGYGQFARGQLVYEKGETDADGIVQVKVSGDLKGEGRLGDDEIKNGLLRVSGQQSFDPARGEWVTGLLNVEVSLDLLNDGKLAGAANGTMSLVFNSR